MMRNIILIAVILVALYLYIDTMFSKRIKLYLRRRKQKKKNRAMMQMRKEYYDHYQNANDEIYGRANDAMQQMWQHHEQKYWYK